MADTQGNECSADDSASRPFRCAQIDPLCTREGRWDLEQQTSKPVLLKVTNCFNLENPWLRSASSLSLKRHTPFVNRVQGSGATPRPAVCGPTTVRRRWLRSTPSWAPEAPAAGRRHGNPETRKLLATLQAGAALASVKACQAWPRGLGGQTWTSTTKRPAPSAARRALRPPRPTRPDRPAPSSHRLSRARCSWAFALR